MKTKILLSALCLCMSCTFAYAQITTGKTTSTVIKTGNRPEAGDFGIFIGPSYSEIKDMCDKKIKVRGVPLVNVKYYSSERIEWRLGLQFSKTSEKLKGDITGENNEEEEEQEDEDLGTLRQKQVKSFNRITPGVAYHFSSRNILDVYVGATLPFGWDRDKTVNEMEYKSGADIHNISQGSFVIGIGAFVGLQAFIADLPVSVGLEYGLSGLLHGGQKYKHEIQSGENNKQTYYTKGLTDKELKFSKLSSSKGEFGSDLRVTISYYFR